MLDLDAVRPWFDNVDIDACFKTAGVTRETMERFCRLLTTKKWGCHQDLGVFMSRHNTLNCYLILMLEVLCGVAFMPGGCIVPECTLERGKFSDENNPKVWRGPVTNRFPVLGTYPEGMVPDEVLGDNEDRIRMMFVDASNCVRSYPDSNRMEEAMRALELLVVIDVCMTETAQLADYVLPAKTSYEAYDVNAFQYNYPEVVGHMKHPVIEQTIGERMEGAQIWIELTRACGRMPKMPDWLYAAAEKAAKTGDRIPYFLKLLAWAGTHMKYFDMLPMLVGETLGKYMGSPTRAVVWAAYMTSPIANQGMVEKVPLPKLGFHPVLEKMPGFAEFCRLDAAYQAVDDTPEGLVIAMSDPNTMIDRHIKHKDHKIHLWCREIDDYLKNITPEKEHADLTLNDEYPLVLSAGRHSDNGVNWVMRNADMNRHRDYYRLTLNPDDAKRYGLAEDDMVRISTPAGHLDVPLTISWETAPGYALLPHQFGFRSHGKMHGDGANRLVPNRHLDALTGNPLLRYVPCKVERLEA